jgi:hypothetical protein|tara:strand:- start:1526 stop:2107 length:582 start_codon:yes stop_codon:yes gene_type:complete
MKHLKTFESFIGEAEDGTKVVFFPGRFMPFHKAHLSSMLKTSEEFGLPVIPLQIISKKDKSPFPESLLKKMGADLVKANSNIADYFAYPQDYGRTVIPWFVRFLRDQGYEPMGMGTGSDRLKSYEPQIKYMKGPKTDTVVDPSFELKMVNSRTEDEVSGTAVRQALKDDDKDTFESMMPKELHKYFDKLKKYI